MGSNPSKQPPAAMPPAPGRGIIRGKQGPVPGYPGTYDDIQEQLFTTNNFAPAPRSRHTVNFQDQMAEQTLPIRNAPRAERLEPETQPSDVVDDDVNQPQHADVLTPPTQVRQRVNRPPRDWNDMMDYNAAPYGRHRAPMGVRYIRQPVQGYDNGPYRRRQMAPRQMYRYPHNAYLPRQRPRYMRPQYDHDSPQRYPSGPPPHGPAGYRDAYIPPALPDSTQRFAQPNNMQPYAAQQQIPQDTGIENSMVSRLIDNRNQQQQYGAPPRRRDVYEEENPPVPMFDAERYEVDSLLSAPKYSVEDENEEKHLSPSEVELLSRERHIKTNDDDDYIGANLRFYRNEIPFRPNGEHVDTVHRYWYCDYQRLANTTTFMPWLFPLPQRSRVNPFAEPLKQHEAKHIYKDRDARARYLRSYKMMLDFFGIELISEKTGEVKRARNWRERFPHLNRSKRSHERITRILTSTGQLGFPHLQAPLVLFLFHEVLETKQLSKVPRSTLQDWHQSINNVLDANYVVDQFSKMAMKQNDNQYAKRHQANTIPDRQVRQHVPNMNETDQPNLNQTQPDDNLYRFNYVYKGTEPIQADQARGIEPMQANQAKVTEPMQANPAQQSNHSNKDDRITYREEAERDSKVNVNNNNNNNRNSTADVYERATDSQQENTATNQRLDNQTPVPSTSYYDDQQPDMNRSPRYKTEPPAYSEYDYN